jgi:hypothetical protein
LCPPPPTKHPHTQLGFEEDETYKQAADKTVKLAKQLELEVNVADVEELSKSHGPKLLNEDLMELGAAKVREQTEAEDEYELAEKHDASTRRNW